MAPVDKSREAHFPAIEKKHGQPMTHWHRVMKTIANLKYPEQIAYLRENHGFSQAHANALVMYSRGSTSARRFATVDEYLKSLNKEQQATVTAILDAAHKKFPKLEIVIAWNQPMFKQGKDYVFGLSVASKHVLLAPMAKNGVAKVESLLGGLEANKKTIRVPLGWKVDARLLQQIIRDRLDELSGE